MRRQSHRDVEARLLEPAAKGDGRLQNLDSVHFKGYPLLPAVAVAEREYGRPRQAREDGGGKLEEVLTPGAGGENGVAHDVVPVSGGGTLGVVPFSKAGLIGWGLSVLLNFYCFALVKFHGSISVAGLGTRYLGLDAHWGLYY